MTTHLEPDLRPSYLEHRAMRTDAARLTELVIAAQPSDDERLQALAAWYGHYERAIHDHHTAEEAVVYPALLERDPSFAEADGELEDRKSTRLNSSHANISYAVFCLKKKKKKHNTLQLYTS